jgi:hypothetical protein
MPRPLQFVLYSLLVLIPAVWMTYEITKTPSITCEVCIEYRGQTKCREARGPDRDQCQRTASDNACAFLASGMTDSIQCGGTNPKSVTFKEGT